MAAAAFQMALHGSATIFAGGSAVYTVLHDGSEVVSGGVTSGETIFSSSTETVSSGGESVLRHDQQREGPRRHLRRRRGEWQYGG